MSHLVGVIAFIIFAVIVAYWVPQKILIGAAIYFFVAALIVKFSAQFVVKRDVSIFKALAAVVLSLIFVPLAGFLAMSMGVKESPVFFLLAPAFMFSAQLIVYMVMLDVTLFASGLIALLVTLLTWAVTKVAGLPITAVLKAFA